MFQQRSLKRPPRYFCILYRVVRRLTFAGTFARTLRCRWRREGGSRRGMYILYSVHILPWEGGPKIMIAYILVQAGRQTIDHHEHRQCREGTHSSRQRRILFLYPGNAKVRDTLRQPIMPTIVFRPTSIDLDLR